MLNATKNEKINTNNTTEYKDNRTYVEVSEDVKSYPQDLGFEPAGEDEVFVPIEPIDNRWISNHGRMLYKRYDKMKLAKSNRIGNKIGYYLTINDGVRFISVDRIVYAAFVNGDWSLIYKSDYVVWHINQMFDDNYYKHLFLTTKHQYRILSKHIKNGGIDTPEYIQKVIETGYNIPSVYGIGYWGQKKIDTKSVAYSRWCKMLKRCYSESYLRDNPSYRECRVCDEWLNYSNFKKWFDENWYEVDNYEMHLDKDILVKGNKVYSPDTCAFVPKQLNTLILASGATRGKYPLGVCKSGNKFSAEFRINNKTKYLGYYDSAEEAFSAYKEYKEGFIKKITERYKGKIPDKVYDALMNWKIEITD